MRMDSIARIAEGCETEISAGLHQGVEDVILIFDAVMDLVAELANEIHAQHLRRGQPDAGLDPREPGQRRVGDVVGADPFEQHPRLRAGDD